METPREFEVYYQKLIVWFLYHQPKNIDYPYNDDTHRRRFQPSNWHPHVQISAYAPNSVVGPL